MRFELKIATLRLQARVLTAYTTDSTAVGSD